MMLPLVLLIAGCQTAANRGVAVDDSAVSNELVSHAAATDNPTQPADPHIAQLAEAQWQAELGNNRIARESYANILERNANSAEAIVGLARLDQTAGRMTEAEQGFKTALALHPDDVEIISAVAQFYTSQERWSDTKDVLQKGIERHPHEITLTYQLAVLHAKSGQNSLALADFTKAVGEAEAHYNLAIILYESGNRHAAEKHLLQALLLKPDFDDAKTWLADITGERIGQGRARHDRISSGPEPFAPAKTATSPKEASTSATIASETGRTSSTTTIEQISRQVTTPVLENTRRTEISLTDARTDTGHEQAAAFTGSPFAAAPIEPLTNAGGTSRNAQPVRPLTDAMTAAQREQWENQLRARGLKR
ncbi:MAG: tetratricopeptide repeat protein [Planctomycetaceae bacterium]